jgi:ABC-type branched-subunit amino acid transport system substrate-binding protein
MMILRPVQVAKRRVGSRYGFIAVVCLLLLMVMLPPGIQGQAIPQNPEAEEVFVSAIAHFEEQEYGAAFEGFRAVLSDYPLNRKTTAAWLMAGKSLFRSGRYETTIDLLKDFVDRYPGSRYVGEALRTTALATEVLRDTERRGVATDIGILLPLTADAVHLSQSLFNGIRLAVEEHNATGDGATPIRMVFRDSGDDEAVAREAVREMADQGVRLIIGPLYSTEAVAAAEAAEDEGVVLIAPLATEEGVSAGRRFAFQANPTVSMRGRQMARFAMRSMRLRDFAVITDSLNTFSQRMAAAFREEVEAAGDTLLLDLMLATPGSWFRLRDEVPVDTLDGVRGLYLPISGGDAVTLIKAALNEMDRMDLQVQVLGNKEWHDIPARQQASTFRVTYTNDFFVDESLRAVQEFGRRYMALSEEEPNRLAYTGYDVCRFVLFQLTASTGRPLYEVLRIANPYQGLGMRIDFSAGNVNQAMYYHRYRDGRSELLR